jgi:hypothetical protein
MEAESSHQGNRRGRSHAVPTFLSRVTRWVFLLCVPGGALWALSPLGVHLSELKFKSPDVFWKLFLSAPLLLGFGLIGLYLRRSENHGWFAKMGLWTALGGVFLVLVGDTGLFYLNLDETYIMSAPAYRVFRAGLLLFAVGSLLFGLASLKDRTLSLLAGFPLVAGSVGGLFCSLQNLGAFGVTLWTFFGLAWTWTGLVLLTGGLWPLLRQLDRRRETHTR